jgi:hypothetical protein
MSYRPGDITVRNLECYNDIIADKITSNEFISKLTLSLPKLTTSEKLALNVPDGTIVYDTDLDDIQGYSQGAWSSLSSSNITTPDDACFTSMTPADYVGGVPSGALCVYGGASIGDNMYVHNSISSAGAMTLLNADQSTMTNDGALVVDGGVGIGKNLNVGGDVGIELGLIVAGDDGITSETVETVTLTVTDVCTIGDGLTEAIDAVSGALVVDGGVGVALDMYIGRDLNVTGGLEISGLDDMATPLATALTIDTGALEITDGDLRVVNGNAVVSDSISFGGKLGGSTQVVTTASVDIDNHYMILVDSMSTLNLPSLSLSDKQGVIYHIIKRTPDDVTINCNAGDSIVQGGGLVTSIVLDGGLYDRVSLMGDDGSKWYMM